VRNVSVVENVVSHETFAVEVRVPHSFSSHSSVACVFSSIGTMSGTVSGTRRKFAVAPLPEGEPWVRRVYPTFERLAEQPTALRNLVVRSSPVHGDGVFATADIPAPGTPLCWYQGELLTSQQLNQRHGNGRATRADFALRLESGMYVDGEDAAFANVARFFNHPPPGTAASAVFSPDGLVVSTQPILAGTEIFVDYGNDYFHGGSPPSQAEASVDAGPGARAPRLATAGPDVGAEPTVSADVWLDAHGSLLPLLEEAPSSTASEDIPQPPPPVHQAHPAQTQQASGCSPWGVCPNDDEIGLGLHDMHEELERGVGLAPAASALPFSFGMPWQSPLQHNSWSEPAASHVLTPSSCGSSVHTKLQWWTAPPTALPPTFLPPTALQPTALPPATLPPTPPRALRQRMHMLTMPPALRGAAAARVAAVFGALHDDITLTVLPPTNVSDATTTSPATFAATSPASLHAHHPEPQRGQCNQQHVAVSVY